ncbi:ABC transporter substrate-binding protein [Thermoproteota archaeon]
MKTRKALSEQRNLIIIAVVIIAIIGIYWFTRPSPPPTDGDGDGNGGPPPENVLPIIQTSADNNFGLVNQEITFTAAGSRDPDGEIVTYEWSFGDGEIGEGLEAVHIYETPGEFVVTCVITDDAGDTVTNDVQPIFVKIERAPFTPTLESRPVALIAVASSMVDQGEPVTFDGSSSYGFIDYRGEITGNTGEIESFSWDFGDGSTGEEGTASHTYSEPGNYFITLTVNSKNGKQDTVGRGIRVLPEGVEYVGEIRNPDTYTYASQGWVLTYWDLHRVAGSHSRLFTLSITDLLARTGQGDIEPKTEESLSERWEVSDDGLQYTFYLRKGIKFWNGEELTAEDVEYSYERSLALWRARGRYAYPGVTWSSLTGVPEGEPISDEVIKNSVEVIDKYTIRFNLGKPYAPFLSDMAWPDAQGILNKKYAIEHGAWSWDDTRDWEALDGWDEPMSSGEALMCTGPYIPVLDEWSPGERMVFVRFEDYWQGPAPIKNIRVIFAPEWSTRKLLLQSAEADSIAVRSADQFEQLIDQEGIKPILAKYSGSAEFLYFGVNFDPAVQVPQNQVPPDFFADVHMRKAFAYAFPYEKYIEEVYLGYAERAKGPLPEGRKGAFVTSPYEYDPEKAIEELKLAHGGKYWEEGFQVTAGTQGWATETHGIAYQLLAAEFQKIDPKFKVIPVPATWTAMLTYPIGIVSEKSALDPSNYDTIYHSQHSWEYSYGWKNERFDELIEASVVTPLIEDRLPLIEEAAEIAAEECPVLPLIYVPGFAGVRDYIDGFWYQVNHRAGGTFYSLTKGQ